MFEEKLKFKNSLSLNLSAVFEGESKDAPLVILCHGYNSSKNSVTNYSLAKELVKRGISVFRFDFTGNGESEGNLEDLTPTQGLEDLKSAVALLRVKDFGLYGASFGGYVCLLYAAKSPVTTLALRAPVSNWVGITKELEHAKRFAEEYKEIDLHQGAKNISKAVLIVHGDNDEVVPIEQSKKLFDSIQTNKRLEVVPGASHQFRGRHLEKTNKLIADFFKDKLL